ncbi:MAG: FlgD immunoglobulin-like domain containing protein [Alphaproteobacteria bacterium]
MADDIATISSTTNTGQTQEQLSALNSLSSNFDNFLTILTTQLQNQDPLSPLDTHEFTNQLVMFADVEQSVRQSGQLDDLIALQRQSGASTAVSYIGQAVRADYNEVMFQGDPVNMTYTLPEDADTGALEIYNQEGDLVTIIAGIEKSYGTHTVTWDGTDSFGNTLPDGAYSFQIGAVNRDDQPIDATYETEGIITGAEFEDGVTTLLMGDVRIPLSKILRVEDPTI